MTVQELIDKLLSLKNPEQEVFISPVKIVPVIDTDDLARIADPDHRFAVLGVFGMTNVQQEPWQAFTVISFNPEEHADHSETVH